MRPISLSNETHILQTQQTDAQPLSVHVHRVKDVPVISTAFLPSPEDLIAIADGKPLYIHVMGLEWAPLLVTVQGTEEWKAVMREA